MDLGLWYLLEMLAIRCNRIIDYDYSMCKIFTSEVIHTGMEQRIPGKPTWCNTAYIVGIMYHT